MRPVAKVQAVGVTGALVTLLMLLPGVNLTPEAAAALATVLATLAGYAKRS